MTYNSTIEEENKEIIRRYKDLLKGTYQKLTEEDKKNIRKAFDLAVKAHSKQRRKSGEPYIYHPLAVAKIVAYSIGLGSVSIQAALLHDVVEDTSYNIKSITSIFGETVARIVSGLTKISNLKKDQDISIQAENFRKMLLTLNDDIRVILIKIADRLHNMQTLWSMPANKQRKIASETLYIYAPLAHRLGLFNIKTELEDLGLKYTEPDVYNDISQKIIQNKEDQDQYIQLFTDKLKKKLNLEYFTYSIKGRYKSIYSISKKMRQQEVSFDEVYDKFAIRIIYKSTVRQEKFDAWKIYSIVTDNYQPKPTRLRDWISRPKSTGYESLHTTVMGPLGRWVEVQIRSERMNEIAEKGYAAHYRYKNAFDGETILDSWLNKLKETLENQETNAIDFVENFKLNLYTKEIFVFTPKGDLKPLPKGSSALDFAFSIHTQVGMTCRGARVNGKLMPINHKLNNGDQVEIVRSVNQKPNARWLDFVVTARARAKIKSALKQEQKQIAKDGKEILTRKLKQLKILLSTKNINELVSYFQLKTSLELFYKVGSGTIDNKQLKEFAGQKNNMFINFFKNKIRKTNSSSYNDTDEIKKFDLLVFGEEEEPLEYKLANCCNPIPGDNVFGFITVNEGIKIHTMDCPNAISIQAKYAYRVINAKWVDSSKQDFQVILNIKGSDKLGIVSKLTQVISNNMNVNIESLNISGNEGVFKGTVTITIKNKTQLDRLINNIKKIEGINKIERTYRE